MIKAASPANLNGTAASPATVNLNWTPYEGVASYRIYRSDRENGEYTPIAETSNAMFQDKGLTPGKTYYYKVSFYEAEHESELAGPIAVNLQTVPVPENLQIRVLGPDRFQLIWNGNEEYILYRNANINDLEARMNSKRGRDKRRCPPSPTDVTARADTCTAIALSWSTSRGAKGYKVYRSTNPGGPFTLIRTVDATEYTDENLERNTTYYYKIAAFNGTGTGERSGTVNATTPARCQDPCCDCICRIVCRNGRLYCCSVPRRNRCGCDCCR